MPSAVALCRQQGARREGTLWMPRFQAEGHVELSEQPKRLGAPRAFTNEAELPGVSIGPLKVDQVIHKVKVEVVGSGKPENGVHRACGANKPPTLLVQ